MRVDFSRNKIRLIAGKTGQGKTLLALVMANEYLKEGYYVYTNIRINDNHERLIYTENFYPLMQFYGASEKRLFLIDEIATAEGSEFSEFARFLIQSRKAGGASVIMIAQDYRFFPIELRRLAHEVVVPRYYGRLLLVGSSLSQEAYEQAYAVGGADRKKERRLVKRKYRAFEVYRYFGLYDTKAFVKPPGLTPNRLEKKWPRVEVAGEEFAPPR